MLKDTNQNGSRSCGGGTHKKVGSGSPRSLLSVNVHASMDICAQILIMKHNASIILEGSRLQTWDAPNASGAYVEAACH